ncbi:MAG: diguanylate cyclase [Vicinamibacterales bacterium]
MPTTTPYVLIAVSNVARATAFCHVATESLRLESVMVRDGDDAVDQLSRRGAPALLVVDLSLPRVDGFTIVRRMRRLAADHQTRVIAVSAHESLRAAARELAASLGITGILSLDADALTIRNTIFAGLDPSHEDRRRAGGVAADGVASKAPVSVGPDEVVERAAVEVRRRFRMPVSVSYLRVADHEGLTFHVSARHGEHAWALHELVDASVLRQVAESNEPLVVPSLESHPVYASMGGDGRAAVKGFAIVPVVSTRESIRAALCVLDTQTLTLSASDVDALAAYGRHAGLELDRMAAAVAERKPQSLDLPDDIEALQHLAATDPLTGVANRRGGEKHISNEISRAKREKRPLSCILVDIDRFKAVNDTFGHQAGDQLLRDISALLRRTVRAYDILVRWGGEEFLVVLPGVGLETARMLADRLRSAVESLDTHGIGPVTVSAGAAEFENDYDFASTLRTADRRLYQAKAAGRNCVV